MILIFLLFLSSSLQAQEITSPTFLPKGASMTIRDNTIKATGPLGGIVEKQISFKPIFIREGIIKDKNPNPLLLDVLPSLCPRVTLDEKNQALYHGHDDRLNNIPTMQLFDPDSKETGQLNIYKNTDGKNALLLKKIKLTFDYEDNSIIDFQGINPFTGKDQVLYEGNGGFYSNIHYAVIPYDKKILSLDKQTLLHLVQGKLHEIGRDDLRPALRTHSFIPGPFLSKNTPAYTMCEWGDTSHQAPVQYLNYEDILLWDWDYPVSSTHHILLIVWESDEEEGVIKKHLIEKTYMIDDLIGIFDIKKENTKTPLTLTSKNKDFTITVITGNLAIPPAD